MNTTKPILNIDAFQNAIRTFDEALGMYENDNRSIIRDGCIQRFEYCYDFATKIIKRYLKIAISNTEEIDGYTFQQVIRQAYKVGILKNSWDVWHKYRDNRNVTSHSYDEEKAMQVMKDLPDFYDEVLYLQKALQEKIMEL